MRPEVKAYSETIIRTIRAIDPDNIILVGSPHWDQDIHLPAADPITGQSNLMYTLHFYAATHKQWLRDRSNEAIAKGLPVFCVGIGRDGSHRRWSVGPGRMEPLDQPDGRTPYQLDHLVCFG